MHLAAAGVISFVLLGIYTAVTSALVFTDGKADRCGRHSARSSWGAFMPRCSPIGW